MTTVTAKPYLSQVRRHLTCSAASRRRLLEQGRQMLEDFLQETPNADTAALTAAFGEPREFAIQMLATLEPEEVEAGRKRRRRVKRSVITLVALALILAAVICFTKWRQAQAIVNGDFYVMIQPARTLSPGEADELHNDPNIIWEGD